MDTNRDSSAKELEEERISPPQGQPTLSRRPDDLEGVHHLRSYSPLLTYPDDLGEIHFSPWQIPTPTSYRYTHDPELYTTYAVDPVLTDPNSGYESRETEGNVLREGRLEATGGPWTQYIGPSFDDPWTSLSIDPSAQSTNVSSSRQPIAHHSEGDEGSDPDFRIPWDIDHIGEAADPASLKPNESTPSLNVTAGSVNEEYSTSPDRASIRRYNGPSNLARREVTPFLQSSQSLSDDNYDAGYRADEILSNASALPTTQQVSRHSETNVYPPPPDHEEEVGEEVGRGAQLTGQRTDTKRTGDVPKPPQRLGRPDTSSKGGKGKQRMSPDVSPNPPSQRTQNYRKGSTPGPLRTDYRRTNREVQGSWGFRESEDFCMLLENSYDAESTTRSFEIVADWELPQFCEAELEPDPDSDVADLIFQVLTITCPVLHCEDYQALSCQDYTKLVWGPRGEDILRFILTNGVREGQFQFQVSDLTLQVLFPGSQHPTFPRETALLRARGQPRDVADALEQFAWIACTFRPPNPQFPLSRSTVSIARDLTNRLGYVLRLDPLLQLELPPTFLFEDDSNSSCWTSVIPCAVVATGFPIRKRKFSTWARGLEIPFEIMVALAKVSALTDVEGHQILVGPSKILCPTELLMPGYAYGADADADQVKGVQWHCIISDSLTDRSSDQVLRELVRKAGANTKIADLVGLRCFLGYFEKATVHLGTEEPAHQEAVPLGLPRSGQRIELAREGTLTLGFNIPGIVNGSIAGKVLLTRSLQIALGESKEYEDLLTDSKNQSVVLYDVDARIGWLVSELSVVLYICHTFLRLPDTQPRFRGTCPELPLATAAGDGGQSALQLIHARGDTHLWKKALGGEHKTFHSLVNDFLRDVRTLRNASLIHQQSSSSKLLPVLCGLELGDIVMKKDFIHEKKLPDNIVPPWWPLCGERKVYTIFHTGLGQVIRPASRVPLGWDVVLTGANLLVSSMACVWQLNSSALHPKQRACSCFHITDNVVWDPTVDTCRDCEDSARNMVQALRQIPMYYSEADYPGPRKLPNACGAVIFGDHSLFHRAVNQLSIGTHRLDRHLRRN